MEKLRTINDLCDFLNAAPSPYHAVHEAARRLEAGGFSRLDETAAWELSPGAKHYVTRSDGSLAAFRAGTKSPAEGGFRIIGAHTDSPNLRLKPIPTCGVEGYAQLGVEIYGGVLLYSWLDRDLGLAGRIIVEGEDGRLERHIVRLDASICRVPSVAIHLNRKVNDEGLVLNKQKHMVPVLGLGEPAEQYGRLLDRFAKQVGFSKERVRGFDLGLFDTAPAKVGGLNGEFIFSGRLDNLTSCHSSITALIQAQDRCPSTRVVMLFDHEEVGSSSAQGAGGPFLSDLLRRIGDAMGDVRPADMARAVASSFCISSDMAHAVHPAYVDKHEPAHMPRMNQGPVVKTNVQQRYATDGLSAARFRDWCKRAEVPFQELVSRTDMSCGSTIGPLTASQLGIATVDVGNPMLSMHSTREMSGSADVGMMLKVFDVYFGG